VEMATRLAADHEPPGKYPPEQLARILGLDVSFK
jgi:hypothetical protein